MRVDTFHAPYLAASVSCHGLACVYDPLPSTGKDLQIVSLWNYTYLVVNMDTFLLPLVINKHFIMNSIYIYILMLLKN